MEVEMDEEFKRKFIDSLVSERDGKIHVTDLIYCLRKAYYRKKGTKGLAEDKRILAQASGRGIHTILETSYWNEVPVERDGIVGTIDMIKDTVVEIKTTRNSVAIRDSWVRQIMSYLAMRGETEARLIVFDVARLNLEVYRLKFTKEELEEHWKWMLERKKKLEEALKNNNPPDGPEYDWECQYCEYRFICPLSGINRQVKLL